MKRTVRTLAYLSLVLFGACQRSETYTTSERDTSATVAANSSTTSAANETQTTSKGDDAMPYDLQFIDSLTKHHQMAVEMAKAGEKKFEHQPLKAAAKKIIVDQTKEIAQLRQWRDQWYPGAAAAENMQMPGMSKSMNMDMSHMQTMSGNALDLMFIDMMIQHHQGALAMGQDALAKAEHQELKDLAKKIIDAQKKEIDQMEKWKKAWTK